VSCQTISGTGAVHLGGLFLSRFHPRSPKPAFYLSIPTWANHNQIFKNIGARIADYPYFNVDTRGLDYNRLIGAILTAPHFSVFVFHACAHNPTGVDPTKEQWIEIAKAMRASNHFPFFDTAYQGFASGDLDNDAWAIRHFAEEGFEFAVAQSFAKNLGLYGERVGAFHFITSPGPTAVETTKRVTSQLNVLQRSEISNPPAYGARIAATIMNDKALFAEWQENLRTMSGRIIDMRAAVRQLLEEKGTPGTWNHITDQIGMFSFTGLTELQVYILKDKWHIYMVRYITSTNSPYSRNNKLIPHLSKTIDQKRPHLNGRSQHPQHRILRHSSRCRCPRNSVIIHRRL
jgi:aspartate aminotransferase